MYVTVATMAKVVGGSTNKTWTLDSAKVDLVRRRR
jgi:hypothetical protein